MIRPQILFRDIAETEAAKSHPHYCPINDWHQDEFGLSLPEQFAAGLAIAVRADTFEESKPLEKRSLVGAAYMADVTSKLGYDPKVLFEILCADRSWYKREFEKRPDTLPNMAWDRIPFEARPLLQLSNDELLAISREQSKPGSAMASITDRSRHLAARDRQGNSWTSMATWSRSTSFGSCGMLTLSTTASRRAVFWASRGTAAEAED